LNRFFPGEHKSFLVNVRVGVENSDDAKSAVGNFIVRVLTHQNDSFAQSRVEFLYKFLADYDAAIG
jgi:hypothetical protein